MTKEMRKRGKHFTDGEINVFLNLLENHLHIIRNKKNDGNTLKEKTRTWELFCHEFNNISGHEYRTVGQLRTFYDNFKRRVKKEWIEERDEFTRNGSIPGITKLSHHSLRLINMLGNSIHYDENNFDTYDSEKVLKSEDFENDSIEVCDDTASDNDGSSFTKTETAPNENDMFHGINCTNPFSTLEESSTSLDRSDSNLPINMTDYESRSRKHQSDVHERLNNIVSAKETELESASLYYKKKCKVLDMKMKILEQKMIRKNERHKLKLEEKRAELQIQKNFIKLQELEIIEKRGKILH